MAESILERRQFPVTQSRLEPESIGCRPTTDKLSAEGQTISSASSRPIIMETRGLAKCTNCGQRAFELFKLTAEDIQRVHSPEEMGIYWGVCWDCREKLRSAARLEVDYATSKALRDIALFTLFFSATLVLLKLLVPTAIIFVYGLAFFTGIMYLFRRSSGRYAFTHNLAWSIKNRNAMIGVSLIVASFLIVLVPL